MPLYGWMFWGIGIILIVLGIVELAAGSPLIGAALLAGGLLLILQTFLPDAAPPPDPR